MIPRRTLINLGAFLGLAALLITYGFVSLVHNPFAVQRTAATVLPDTGGLKPGFSVTMRGVPVGSVTGLSLVPSGVRVSFDFQPGQHIPADVAARVQRANPLGEQQLDLVPQHGGSGPELGDGATVPAAPDPVPPAVGDVVNAANRLFDTIPTADLAILVHQTALALAGRAQDLRTIVDSITTISETFLRYQDGFKALLANSPPVLDAVASVGPQLQQALANTVVLSQLLAQHRNDLVQLFDNSAALGAVGTKLLATESPNLACLFHDLGDLSANVAEPTNLHNLDSTLELNQYFFGPIDAITPTGPFKSLGNGSPTRDNQTWFRVRTLLPPAQPPASAYAKPRSLPPTKPGGACLTVFGAGVGPATQSHPSPPGPGGSVIPAPAPGAPVGAGAPGVSGAALASTVAAPPATGAAATAAGAGLGQAPAPSAPAGAPATGNIRPMGPVPAGDHPEVGLVWVALLLGLGLLSWRHRPALIRAVRSGGRRLRAGGRP